MIRIAVYLSIIILWFFGLVGLLIGSRFRSIEAIIFFYLVFFALGVLVYPIYFILIASFVG